MVVGPAFFRASNLLQIWRLKMPYTAADACNENDKRDCVLRQRFNWHSRPSMTVAPYLQAARNLLSVDKQAAFADLQLSSA